MLRKLKSDCCNQIKKQFQNKIDSITLMLCHFFLLNFYNAEITLFYLCLGHLGFWNPLVEFNYCSRLIDLQLLHHLFYSLR